ncbi:MAG TPA: GNAT family N-acetyltransferase [Terriglobales bacterium]|nr:GNAT family N-acetyltransferase [Terriglobales bacterium]
MQPEMVRYIPEIVTERLLLRALRPTDEIDVFSYARDPEVANHTLWEPHENLNDTRVFLAFVAEQHRSGRSFIWAIVHNRDRRVIGTVGLTAYVPNHARAEMGFAIARPYWNQGYTTEAVKAMLSFALRDLGLNRVEAFCKLENIGSARVMEKAGMRFEGILRGREFIKGRYEDVRMYAMLKQDLR